MPRIWNDRHDGPPAGVERASEPESSAGWPGPDPGAGSHRRSPSGGAATIAAPWVRRSLEVSTARRARVSRARFVDAAPWPASLPAPEAHWSSRPPRPSRSRWPSRATGALAIAAGLTVLTIGMWATSALPEHIVSIIFFVARHRAGDRASRSVVLSGFPLERAVARLRRARARRRRAAHGPRRLAGLPASSTASVRPTAASSRRSSSVT